MPRIVRHVAVDNLVDVERVEVLKGAQGGLYGRNATGGVVNIITRQPNDELSAEGILSYGTKKTFRGAASINIPLAEGLSFAASGERDSHRGYIRNLLQTRTPYSAANFPTGSYIGTPQQTANFFNSAVNPPSRINRQDFWAGDAKLKMEVGDFKLTVAADYANKDDDSGNEYTGQDPERARGLVAGIFGSFGINAALQPGFFGPNRKFSSYRSVRSLAAVEDYGASATAVLKLDGVDLTSITALRWNTTRYSDDQTGVAPGTIVSNITNKRRYFYQELRAISTNDGPFEYLVGGSYLNTHVDGSSVISYFPPLNPVLFPVTPTLSSGGVENYSFYAQAGYNFTEALKLTLSGRYIHESNSVTFRSPVNATTSISAKKFLPAATLSYELDGGGNIYARYAKGFKAGGVNTVDPPTVYPTALGKQFGPEQVDTYETGLRVPLFDRRVQFTTAVFYNKYKGLQTFTGGNAANPGIIFAVINAGSARTYGAEATLNWQIVPALSIGANAGYLNAKYKRFVNPDATVFNAFDFSGRRMLLSPEWQLGFNANLDQPITDQFNLTGSALASFIDDVKFFNSATPGVPDSMQPHYWLVNARLGIRTSDKKYQLSAFATNLFNRAYFTSGNSGRVRRAVALG